MGIRMIAVFASVGLGACASAMPPGTGGDDDPGNNNGTVDGGPGSVDANVDAPVIPPDACADTDTDGVCNIADTCAGFDDNVDTDADTFADGCDRCAGVDDRIDVNTNTTPDCLELMTRTIDLKSVNGNLWRGWHSSAGGHASDNENTLTGEFSGATYNTYYVFPLAGFTATTINSVTLELQLENYSSTDANETISIWDVTTPAATVETTATNATIFNDLQSGAQYGMATLASAQLNGMISTQLAAQAAIDVKAKLGSDFTVGVHLDTPPGYVRFGHTGTGATPTVIRLVVGYLP